MSFAPVGVQRYWNLLYAGSKETALDDHFGRKLHACASLIELTVVFLGESTHATIDIVDGRVNNAVLLELFTAHGAGSMIRA